jgi:hypothetical protein
VKKLAVILFCIFINILSTHALDTCVNLAGEFCATQEFCLGHEEWAYDANNIVSKCCVGTCTKYSEINCENISASDIDGAYACQVRTSKEQITNYKKLSIPLFIKLLNPQIPAKPYPALWDFWFKIVASFAAIIIVFSGFNYFRMQADPMTTPERLDRFKARFVFIFVGGVFMLILPYITTSLFTSVDIVMTGITRIFIGNGDLLTLVNSITLTLGKGFMYFIRDMLYFLLILILLFRYFWIYILLVFSPIMIMMYFFYLTEPIGDKWMKSLLINILIPIIWVLVFALMIPIAMELSTASVLTMFALPLFLSIIIGFNIYLYWKLNNIAFNFKAISATLIKNAKSIIK